MSNHLLNSAIFALLTSLVTVPAIAQTTDLITPEPRPVAPRISPAQTAPSGIITTVAGDGYIGDSGNGGPALKAQFIEPSSVAVDTKGDVFILDGLAAVVRKVTVSTGIVSLYAGTGEAGYFGDKGPATSAELNDPSAIAVDSNNNLYISDFGNNVIREVNGKTGIITTIAGDATSPGLPPNELAPCATRVDGVPATKSPLCGPFGIAFDGADNLYFADFYNYTVRKIAATTGIISTVAGTGIATYPVGGGSWGYTGDGGPAIDAQLGYPTSVTVDKAGNVYFLDFLDCAVRKVAAGTGIITSLIGTPSATGFYGTCGLSGDGGPASLALINPGIPNGLVVDANGNIFIGDSKNQLVRMISASNGDTYTIGGSYQSYFNGQTTENFISSGYSGDRGPGVYSLLNVPQGLALDLFGNLYIADSDNRVIRKITVPSPPPTETPVISPNSGAIAGATSVEITAPIAGSKIYYTTNGTIPTTGSTEYSGAFNVSTSTLVTAFATIPGKFNSQAVIAGYLYAPPPVFSAISHSFTGSMTVSLSDTNPQAKIYYSVDGLSPTYGQGTLYTGPITIANSTSFQAAALVSLQDADGKEYSGWSSETFATYNNLAARAPAATTTAATGISEGWVTLNGIVTANNATTGFSFIWGTNSNQLTMGNISSLNVVTGTKPTAVGLAVQGSNFQPKTTYYFKIVAQNAVGTTDASNVLSFTMP